MERYTVMPENIENETNREVVKQSKVSMGSIGLILLAAFLALGAFAISDPNSSLSTLLLTAAVFMALGGLIKLCMGRNCYIYKPTGSRIKRMTVYFDNKECQNLKDCIESGKFEILKSLKRQVNFGVKMDAMVAADNCFVAIQLSEYVPYTYEAVSPVRCYYNEEARVLSDFFKNNR